MPKIPFWATVARSYRLVFGRMIDLVSLGALTIVALFVLGVLTPDESWVSATGVRVRPAGNGTLADWRTSAAALAGYLVALGASLAFVVAWSRSVLLDERAIWLRFGRRELRTLGFAALIGLMLLVVTFAVQWGLMQVMGPFFVSGLSGKSVTQLNHVFIAMTAGSYVTALIVYALGLRLAFAFPGIALGRPQVLGAAWDLSQKNMFRLLLGTLLVMGPALAIAWFARHMFGPPWQIGLAGRMGLTATQVVAEFVAFALEITFIALSYAHLAQERPQALVYADAPLQPPQHPAQ